MRRYVCAQLCPAVPIDGAFKVSRQEPYEDHKTVVPSNGSSNSNSHHTQNPIREDVDFGCGY